MDFSTSLLAVGHTLLLTKLERCLLVDWFTISLNFSSLLLDLLTLFFRSSMEESIHTMSDWSMEFFIFMFLLMGVGESSTCWGDSSPLE